MEVCQKMVCLGTRFFSSFWMRSTCITIFLWQGWIKATSAKLEHFLGPQKHILVVQISIRAPFPAGFGLLSFHQYRKSDTLEWTNAVTAGELKAACQEASRKTYGPWMIVCDNGSWSWWLQSVVNFCSGHGQFSMSCHTLRLRVQAMWCKW